MAAGHVRENALFVHKCWGHYKSSYGVPNPKYFSSTILISSPKANLFYHSYPEISLFTAGLSKIAVIWTHDHDVRDMGLFSILRLLCNAKFL